MMVLPESSQICVIAGDELGKLYGVTLSTQKGAAENAVVVIDPEAKLTRGSPVEGSEDLVIGLPTRGALSATAPSQGRPARSLVLRTSPSLCLVPESLAVAPDGSYLAVAGCLQKGSRTSAIYLVDLQGAKSDSGVISSSKEGVTPGGKASRGVTVHSSLFSFPAKLRIYQMMWHPHSKSHFLVLTSDNHLRVFGVEGNGEPCLVLDLNQACRGGSARGGGAQRKYGIRATTGTTSVRQFAFGPPTGWGVFTLYLLTSTGLLYSLCPVAPPGMQAPASVLSQCYAEAQSLSQAPQITTESGPTPSSPFPSGFPTMAGGHRSSAQTHAQQWLCQTFGVGAGDEFGHRGAWTVLPSHQHHQHQQPHHSPPSSNATALQGPLNTLGQPNTTKRPPFSCLTALHHLTPRPSPMDSAALDPLHGHEERSSTLGKRGAGVGRGEGAGANQSPCLGSLTVLVVGTQEGVLQTFLLLGQITPCWSKNPSGDLELSQSSSALVSSIRVVCQLADKGERGKEPSAICVDELKLELMHPNKEGQERTLEEGGWGRSTTSWRSGHGPGGEEGDEDEEDEEEEEEEEEEDEEEEEEDEDCLSEGSVISSHPSSDGGGESSHERRGLFQSSQAHPSPHHPHFSSEGPRQGRGGHRQSFLSQRPRKLTFQSLSIVAGMPSKSEVGKDAMGGGGEGEGEANLTPADKKRGLNGGGVGKEGGGGGKVAQEKEGQKGGESQRGVGSRLLSGAPAPFVWVTHSSGCWTISLPWIPALSTSILPALSAPSLADGTSSLRVDEGATRQHMSSSTLSSLPPVCVHEQYAAWNTESLESVLDRAEDLALPCNWLCTSTVTQDVILGQAIILMPCLQQVTHWGSETLVGDASSTPTMHGARPPSSHTFKTSRGGRGSAPSSLRAAWQSCRLNLCYPRPSFFQAVPSEESDQLSFLQGSGSPLPPSPLPQNTAAASSLGSGQGGRGEKEGGGGERQEVKCVEGQEGNIATAVRDLLLAGIRQAEHSGSGLRLPLEVPSSASNASRGAQGGPSLVKASSQERAGSESAAILSSAITAMRKALVEQLSEGHEMLRTQAAQMVAESASHQGAVAAVKQLRAQLTERQESLQAQIARAVECHSKLAERTALLTQLHWSLPRPLSQQEVDLSLHLDVQMSVCLSLKADHMSTVNRASTLIRQSKAVAEASGGQTSAWGSSAVKPSRPQGNGMHGEGHAEQRGGREGLSQPAFMNWARKTPLSSSKVVATTAQPRTPVGTPMQKGQPGSGSFVRYGVGLFTPVSRPSPAPAGNFASPQTTSGSASGVWNGNRNGEGPAVSKQEAEQMAQIQAAVFSKTQQVAACVAKLQALQSEWQTWKGRA